MRIGEQNMTSGCNTLIS